MLVNYDFSVQELLMFLGWQLCSIVVMMFFWSFFDNNGLCNMLSNHDFLRQELCFFWFAEVMSFFVIFQDSIRQIARTFVIPRVTVVASIQST